MVLRVFYYSILAAGIYAYAGVWYSKQIQMLYRFSSIMFIMLCTCSLIIDAALLVSRSLSVEIREQNLAALMLLPDRFAYICYSKIFGAFLIWLPGPIALALVFICTVDGQSFADEIYNHQLTYAWIITAYCVIPHVAAVASLLTRWGAVPIGICIGLANLFISVSILSYLTVIQDSEVFLWIALINLGLCCVCHVSVGRQFKSLAARS